MVLVYGFALLGVISVSLFLIGIVAGIVAYMDILAEERELQEKEKDIDKI